MLLWMSRLAEALLSGLSGGAEHGRDGAPGGMVLRVLRDVGTRVAWMFTITCRLCADRISFRSFSEI